MASSAGLEGGCDECGGLSQRGELTEMLSPHVCRGLVLSLKNGVHVRLLQGSSGATHLVPQ